MFNGKIWEGCSVFGFDYSLGTDIRVRVIWDAESDQHNTGEIWKVEFVIRADGNYLIFDADEIFYSEDMMGLMYADRMEW